MDVIFISKGKEADAREKLRQQINRVERGEANFETAASGVRPRHYTKAYAWQIAYSNRLAGEWLERQELAIREAVQQIMSPAGGGPPGNQQIRGALIEYLMYRESHATSIRVDLYYVINRMNNEFEGWGTAPPAAGRAEPLALQVSGHEEDGGRRVILHFSQAAQHVKVGGLDGDIKALLQGRI